MPPPANMLRAVLCLYWMLAACGIAMAQATTQPSDPIAEKLSAAKTQQAQAVDDANKELLRLIDQRINAAADNGDLSLVQSLQAIRTEAQTNGEIPGYVEDPAVRLVNNDYEKHLAAAREKLKSAYQNAVRDYTRARDFDRASSTQDELDSLLQNDPTMKPRVVDLLPLVDPKRDTFAGHWILKDGKLSNERVSFSQIRFPYRPPDEYDFHLVYDRENADWGIILGVCHLSDMFACGMPDWRDSAATAQIDGFEARPIQFPAPTSAATHCDVCVQVRNDRLTILINGEKSLDRPMAQWDLAQTPAWFAGTQKFGLGLADWWGHTTISKAEVVEISGPGEILGGGTPQ